jgi:hypothetical protein
MESMPGGYKGAILLRFVNNYILIIFSFEIFFFSLDLDREIKKKKWRFGIN